MWQDPMDDTQQLETRRRIKVVLKALIEELKNRGMNVIRQDDNTLLVNGMTFTATDQLSDTYNDVCYLLTDYNQMIDCTLSRISECADTIEELLKVQVEKMSFNDMVKKQRARNNIKKDEISEDVRNGREANIEAYRYIISVLEDVEDMLNDAEAEACRIINSKLSYMMGGSYLGYFGATEIVGEAIGEAIEQCETAIEEYSNGDYDDTF